MATGSPIEREHRIENQRHRVRLVPLERLGLAKTRLRRPTFRLLALTLTMVLEQEPHPRPMPLEVRARLGSEVESIQEVAEYG